MTDRRRLARINQKFAALGVVGAVMVLLPLAQLLRYQSAELQTLAMQRAALDPMADAVALQRSLMAHADAARPVLQGKVQAEPQRLQRKADVDSRLTDLSQALSSGQWSRAIGEAQALATDWAELAQQVASRSIGVAQSDLGHRLRVEQALQVMDLLALALGPDEPGAPGAIARTTADLPRLAQQMATSTPAAADTLAAQAAAARLQQVLSRLRSLPIDQADGALAAAIAQAGLRTQQWQAALAQPAPDWLGARDLAVQAQLDLLVLARSRAATSLDEREQSVRLGRATLVLAMTALGALALMLLQHLIRQTTHNRRAPPPPPSRGRTLAESQPEAGRLIQRMRYGDGGGVTTPASDAQPSLPPRV